MLQRCPSGRRVYIPNLTILVNTYHHPASFFVDGDVLYSEEGTTQDDPSAMPFYAPVTVPLIQKLTARVTQVWYVDDAAACGKVSDLHMWWDQVSSLGPKFGYFPNATKTWLITKAQFCSTGTDFFRDTAVNVTADGRPHLGAPVGTPKYVQSFTTEKINNWISEVDTLSSIATTQPHAAYACFTHGLFSRWLYATRTVPDTSSSFQPLEKEILTKFIPALTGLDPPGALQRSLFTLPMRFGGLGIVATDSLSESEYSEVEIRDSKSLSFHRIAFDAYSNSSERCYFSTRKGHFQLAHSPSYSGTWTFIAQNSFLRCSCLEIWLVALTYTFPLCLWHQFFC